MENLKNLDWNEIVEKLETLATSESARGELRRLKALKSSAEAEASFQDILAAQELLSYGERPFMESLDLFSTWFQRLKREAVLQTLELRDCRRFCIECLALEEVFKRSNHAWAVGRQSRMLRADVPLRAIDKFMTPSGEVRPDASDTLARLFQEKSSQTKALQSTLVRLSTQHEMETVLQEKFVTTREGRWVLPVKSGMQHAFQGIIHASSQSKQTVFMEPEEVVPLNNRLRQIEIEIEDEIERLLEQLSDHLRKMLVDFEDTRVIMLECDIRFAQARLADLLEAHPCHFSPDSLHLIEVKHPVLVMNPEGCIGNTVFLDQRHRILLLSGPNAGGKTVLLKSVGLAIHMARCGLFICASEGSKVPFVTHLEVAVGDAQSVDAHLSTFAAHLKALNHALENKGPQSLLLIDEICGSTDPEEGSALARSFVESFAQNKVFGVITSHLSPLKVGWTPDSGIINGSLEYNSQSGLPTYQFLMGIPGQSLAIQTAKRVGVSDAIIQRSLDFLSPTTKAQQQGINEIETLKEEMQLLREELRKETRDARENKRRYHDLIQKFRQEKDQWMDRIVKKTEKKIDQLIEQVGAEQVFKKHERLQQIKNELPEVIKASNSNGARRKIETVEEFEKAYPPGSSVFVSSLNQDGVIQGKANSKGEVPVLSRSMRLFVHWQQLRGPQAMNNPTQQILRRAANVQVTLQDAERVIDVRGQRVDEAISLIELQLDAAALASEDRVKIIHGHGTEVLKKAIRQHLSRSIYVKKWKAASPEGGGDGVTWAELKD